jgi:predicted Zn-dependent peptidase
LVNLKKKGLTDKQLEKYKKQFIDHTSYYFKDNDVIINTFGSYLYYDRDFTFKKYTNLINKITKNKILEIVNQLFDFKKMGFVLYGNVKDIEKTKKGIINIINKYKNL